VSEEVNRKCPPRNTMVQPETLYTATVSATVHAQRHRQTDGQTDDRMMPVADHTVHGQAVILCVLPLPLPSDRHHLSCDDCLDSGG